MDKRKRLKQLLWGAGPAREIISLALRIYREEMYGDREDDPENKTPDPVGALVGLASVYYTLAKRLPFGPCYFYLAVQNADNAYRLSLSSPGNRRSVLTTDQVDVISRIWSKTPNLLGGRLKRAAAVGLISRALRERKAEMKPHTQALMLITQRDILWRAGKEDLAFDACSEAESLLPEIDREDSPDRNEQWVRVATDAALFYFDKSGMPEDKEESRELLIEALDRARKCGARDQEVKILREMEKRDIPV